MTSVRSMIPAALLLSLLASAEPAQSAELTIRLTWEEARVVTAHASFLPKIRIQQRGSQDWTKARLIEVTDAGLRVTRKNRETFVGRADIQSFRLTPNKGQPYRKRTIAAIAAVPVGFGAVLGSWALICGTASCPESGGGKGNLAIPIGVAVPYLIYRQAAKADRGTVTILVRGDNS